MNKMMGENLRKQREELGLSQRQLSKMLGYSDPIVNLYESGKREIPTKFVVAFLMLKEKLKADGK